MSSPAADMGPKVIIVGGGLAGLSAAHTVLERGGRALVIDKKEFLGGNSVKATSGINGTPTSTQARQGIPDNAHVFYEDTALSAAGGKKALVNGKLPDMPTTFPLCKVLADRSGPAVEWLMESFGLDLSLVSRLGGHSFPRTHRGKERFPGMTITSALMEKFDERCTADPMRARLVTKAKVDKLVQDEQGNVLGVEYVQDGKRFKEMGPVVISTGGFCADFGADSLLAKFRPDLLHLPTTNGDHCTGDGIKMTIAAGGATVDMTSVQVHPTGLVHPSEPDAKVKFLAAEALRGVGGLLLTNKGQRFVDELGTRDYVSGEMFKYNAGPYRLVLNGKASNEILWHCKHYMGRGLMKHYKSGADLAKEMGISVSELKKTFDKYNAGAASKKDEFGKRFFHNMPFTVDDEFHVAIVTPVVHYSMGGVQINADAQIVRPTSEAGKFGEPVRGLFAAGEVAGGVHGKNRLGGSGLLGCVVYGRVAGDSACKLLLQNLTDASVNRRIGGVMGQLAPGAFSITVNPGQNSFTVALGGGAAGGAGAVAADAAPAPTASASASPAAVPKQPIAAPAAATASKEYTYDEVAKHNKDTDCWVVINGEVLDVTSFLDRHPGGRHAILLFAGKEASEEYNMIHKPEWVMKYAPECVVGKLKK